MKRTTTACSFAPPIGESQTSKNLYVFLFSSAYERDKAPVDAASGRLVGGMSTLSPAQASRLDDAAWSSVRCERATNVPAELTISQWALESGWGAHQPGNNCFGIKAYTGCYGVQRLQTTEVLAGVRTPVVAAFATFSSLDACFDEHARLITEDRAYALAWGQYIKVHDPETLIQQVALVYATDPSYPNDLLRILAMPEVKGCLAAWRKTS